MALMDWKSLPDTSTPLTPENLEHDPAELNTAIGNKVDKSGDTMTGNLIVGETSATNDKSVQVKNNACHIKLEVKTNGDSGIWNNTLSKYTLVNKANGDLQLNNKVLIKSNGTATFDNDVQVKKSNADAYIYVGDTSYRKINELQTENNTLKVGVGVDAGGAFRIYDYTHSKDILRDTSAGVITFNGSASENLLKKNVARGRVSITPSAPDTPTGVAVSWGKTMDGEPSATATANSSASQIINTAVTGLSATGGTIWLMATNTTARNVFYIAIYL